MIVMPKAAAAPPVIDAIGDDMSKQRLTPETLKFDLKALSGRGI